MFLRAHWGYICNEGMTGYDMEKNGEGEDEELQKKNGDSLLLPKHPPPMSPNRPSFIGKIREEGR